MRIYLKEVISFTNDLNKSVDVASCCQGNKLYFKTTILPDKLKNSLEIKDRDVFNLAEAFAVDSKIHKMTSGTHAAYLYKDSKIIVSFEDIGRHNALVKEYNLNLICHAWQD